MSRHSRLVQCVGGASAAAMAVASAPVAQAAPYNVLVTNAAGDVYVANSEAPAVGSAVVSGLNNIIDVVYGVGPAGDHFAAVESGTFVAYYDLAGAKLDDFVSGDNRTFHDAALLSDGRLINVGYDSGSGNAIVHVLQKNEASHQSFFSGEGADALTEVATYDSDALFATVRFDDGGVIRRTANGSFSFGGFFSEADGLITELDVFGTTGAIIGRSDGFIGLFDDFANGTAEHTAFNNGNITALKVLANGNIIVGNEAGEIRLFDDSLAQIGDTLTGLAGIADIAALGDGTAAVGTTGGDLYILSGADASILEQVSGFGTITAVGGAGLVPEPASFALLGLGALAALRRRR